MKNQTVYKIELSRLYTIELVKILEQHVRNLEKQHAARQVNEKFVRVGKNVLDEVLEQLSNQEPME